MYLQTQSQSQLQSHGHNHNQSSSTWRCPIKKKKCHSPLVSSIGILAYAFFISCHFAVVVMAASNIAVGVKYENEIANSSMTASSWKPGYYPYAARLYKSIGNGSWCAENNKPGEYLQVDIGKERTISRLAIQGDSINNFGVTQFSIVYSQNGVFWKNYTVNEVVKVMYTYLVVRVH